jgi:hypothetical protein
MKKFCSEVFTISENVGDGYLMLEDKHGYVWTDEMIEGLAEEECPQDFIKKYCISCGTQRCDRTKEYLDGCPYYNEYMSIKQNNTAEDESKNTENINRESYVKAESNKYFQEYMNSLCKEHDEMIEGLVEDKNNACQKCGLTRNSTRCLFMDNCPHNKQKNIIEIPEDCVLKDENGNVINATKIVLEKKKKEYPKTFLGCCDVLGIEDLISRGVNGYRSELLDAFQKLLICRDAYWQIAGDEMGLGKPWEPDWCSQTTKYTLRNNANKIIKEKRTHDSYVLAFPTEEMRDAFFNAFREDIEKCKELI